jgi:hypothetical protein
LPEQFLVEAARHYDAVVAADQYTVFRCLGDDLAVFVHDVSHVPSVFLLPARFLSSKIVAMMASHFARKRARSDQVVQRGVAAGNASSIFGITNAAPTSRVPLSSSTTMTDDEALPPRLTVKAGP